MSLTLQLRINLFIMLLLSLQMEKILSLGFQNKFYNASAKAPSASGGSQSEYRINVSSDTPHWYVMDYLTRVSQYYGIHSASVEGKT